MDEPLGRVIKKLDDPDIADALAYKLSGSELTTLLLAVMQRRAARTDSARVLDRYQVDRFVRPGPDFQKMREAEDGLISSVAEGFEWLTLAPLVPLATHSAMGFVDQNNVVATIRGTEVAADPTNGLALEAAMRRRALLGAHPKSADVVRLAAVQRVVRAQYFDNPESFSHFSILALVTAGRDEGSGRFENTSVREHLQTYSDGLTALGARHVRVAYSAWTDDTSSFHLRGVEVVEDPERRPGYYRDVAFKIFATFGTEEFEVGDGGGVDWSVRLCHNRKERMIVSGLGIDRLALRA